MADVDAGRIEVVLARELHEVVGDAVVARELRGRRRVVIDRGDAAHLDRRGGDVHERVVDDLVLLRPGVEVERHAA